MGINIGLDIGSISLKLAAIGKPEDRSILETLCSEKPSFRLMDWVSPAGKKLPLVISDYRRIGAARFNPLSTSCKSCTTSSTRPG